MRVFPGDKCDKPGKVEKISEMAEKGCYNKLTVEEMVNLTIGADNSKISFLK